MGKPLSDHENDRCFTRLAEEKLRPMSVAIEHEPHPRRTVATHRTEHCQTDQLVEAIASINERCPAWIIILS